MATNSRGANKRKSDEADFLPTNVNGMTIEARFVKQRTDEPEMLCKEIIHSRTEGSMELDEEAIPLTGVLKSTKNIGPNDQSHKKHKLDTVQFDEPTLPHPNKVGALRARKNKNKAKKEKKRRKMRFLKSFSTEGLENDPSTGYCSTALESMTLSVGSSSDSSLSGAEADVESLHSDCESQPRQLSLIANPDESQYKLTRTFDF